MAFPSTITIFLLFLLCSASVLPSHADLITIQGVKVAGRLFCSATGNPCPTCSGIAGVNVAVICNGATTSIGSVLTDARGFFNTVLNLADGLLFDGGSSLPCFVTVKLPVAKCTLLPPTGILGALVTFLGNLITGTVGLVAETAIGLFVLVPL